jgi:hypothetical protein
MSQDVVEAFRSLSRLVPLILFFVIVDCGYPLFLVPDSSPWAFGWVWVTLTEAQRVMNWSRSIIAFSDGCTWAHPPGVAPKASVECLDSSEVFCTFYRGMLLYRDMFCPFSFEVWPSEVEPPSLVRTRSIRVLVVFYRSTLTLLL